MLCDRLQEKMDPGLRRGDRQTGLVRECEEDLKPGRTGLLTNPNYVVSGLGHAESVVVTRHLTPCWTTAAGHTNSLTRIRKTHRNTLKGLCQHSRTSGPPDNVENEIAALTTVARNDEN